MANITLYHAAPSRSSIVLWMLEELGQPYDVKLLKLSEGDNMKPDYLAINPMGKVPALKHGDTVITEVAAICTYLADEFPDAKLNVPIGTPRRADRHVELGVGKFVGEISADRGHFGDHGVAVLERGHLAHRIDGEIVRLAVVAGAQAQAQAQELDVIG